MAKLLQNRSASTWKLELTGGIAAAMVLIPEVVTYSLLAGVSPQTALLSTCCIAIVFGVSGGRPGLLSGTSAAMAFIMAHLVHAYGVPYVAAATVLTGLIQLLFGLSKIGRVIRYIPRPVVSGFKNALAILLLLSQLPFLLRSTPAELLLAAAALGAIYGLPRLIRRAALTSPLIILAALTLVASLSGLDIATVGGLHTGAAAETPGIYSAYQILFRGKSLAVLVPFALSLAIVGLLESMMTAKWIEEETDTRTRSDRLVRGQGAANVAAGLLGGVAGSGAFSPTVVSLKNGGRGRGAAAVAGAAAAAAVLIAGDAIGRIPVSALAGILIAVAFDTFDWKSIQHLSRMPGSDVIIMIVTTFFITVTHDLTIGIAAGVLLSFLVIGWRFSRLHVTTERNEHGAKVYTVAGPLFFGTASLFLERFEIAEDPEHIVIDLRHSHVWDHSAVVAIARVLSAYEKSGKRVSFAGMNESSRRLLRQTGLKTHPDEPDLLRIHQQ